MKKNINWSIVWVMLVFLLTAAVITMTGCESKKHIITSSVSNEKDLLKEKEDSLRLMRSVVAQLEQELRQSRYGGVSFQDRCDTALLRQILTKGLVDKGLIDEYLKRLNDCSNEVTIAADGTIKAKGQLKNAFFKEEQFKKVIASMQSKYDSLLQSKQKEQAKEVVKTEYKEAVKIVTVFPWYFWIITAVFAALWLRKQFFSK